MTDIVRGFNYEPDDLCTAQNLALLVSNAQITNLDLTVGGGGFIGISSLTSYTTAPGWMSAFYNAVTGTTNVSGIGGEFVIEINTPNGAVACFKGAGGLETNRFVARHGADWAAHQRGAPLFLNTTSGGVTLTVGHITGNVTYGDANIIGSAYVTSTTSPTLASGTPRIVMQGLGPCFNSVAQGAGNVPVFLWGGGNATPHWSASQSTAVDKVWGHLMTANAPGANQVDIAWFYGRPVWRL